jgi:hypothetical protein
MKRHLCAMRPASFSFRRPKRLTYVVTLFAQRKTTCKNELAEGYGKGKESLFVGYKKGNGKQGHRHRKPEKPDLIEDSPSSMMNRKGEGIRCS